MMARKFCKWIVDTDGNWNTRCKNIFVLIEGTPRENEIKYCPFCGCMIIHE